MTEEDESDEEKTQYKVLLPDYHGLDGWDSAYDIDEGFDEEEAAQEAVEQFCSDGSYPSGSVNALVRNNETGVTVDVEVAIEYVPTFHGHAKRYGPKHCLHKYVRPGDVHCFNCMNTFDSLGITPPDKETFK